MRTNPKETPDLLIFTKEIFNEKLRCLCSVKQVARQPSTFAFPRIWENFTRDSQEMVVQNKVVNISGKPTEINKQI